MKIGVEYPEPNEAKYAQQIADRFIKTLMKYYDSGNTKRMFHPKMHGLVMGTFHVEKNLPDSLKYGLFSKAQTFPAWVRLSNAKRHPQHDKKKDMRGMAIKLVGVPGEKLLKDEHDALTQDFLLVTADRLQTKSVKNFKKSIYALTGGFLHLFFYAITHPGVIVRSLKQISRCDNVLGKSFFSMTPYKLGDAAVKYVVVPQQSIKSKSVDKSDPDYLRKALVADLKENDFKFDFMVQVQEDAMAMPIEDPTVRWKSKFQKVATLTIAQQEFDSKEQREYGENLSFTPWHCLEEHRPLGGVNRARKIVYEQIAGFRRERNDIPNIKEPDDIVSFKGQG